jgi:hypothetical protein
MPHGRRAPAGALEVVGGGGQRIGNAADQIAAAIAITVDRDACVGAGHELRVPEGAGPGAGEPCACRSPRSISLSSASSSPRKKLAAAGAGQRGQRLQQRALAEHAAVVALHAPDRDDGGRIDAVLRGHPIEQVAMLLQQGAAIIHALAIDQRGRSPRSAW